MKLKYTLPLLLITSLSSCSTNNYIESNLFYFDTAVTARLYDGKEQNLKDIKAIFEYYDKISDNYRVRNGENVLNLTSTPTVVTAEFYSLLSDAVHANLVGATYFNPLAGSLAKAWKVALADGRALTDEEIQTELDKINSSSITLGPNYSVTKTGEAEIDLGGIVKGFTLDRVSDYLNQRNIKNFLINAGNSSILVGEKPGDDPYFTIKINDLDNSYLKLKDTTISTSSISIQGKRLTEDGPIYSHIVNPITGSAINLHDAVIVVSLSGTVGDYLSTSMMMNTIEEIKQIEEDEYVETIVIKDKNVIYCNPNLEILHG